MSARVLVAMSGGVDSAVAAALLVAQGHDVTGVHLKLNDLPGAVPGRGCCTLDDAQDARRTAQVLGIPFYVWDLQDVFLRTVREPFARAYAQGRTPNPCIACNRSVKHAGLLDRALALGFDALATGHHARLVRDGAPVVEPGPGARLARARDAAKDQSYVLATAPAAELAATLLPVGELTKDEVRARAAALGLRVAAKPDSYDVCFIPDGDTAGHLAARLPVVPGEVVDVTGRVVGRHDGVWRFTVGQRRGLGLDGHERRFVVDLDAEAARVTVGPREALACRWVDVDAPVWADGRAPEGPMRVQLRAHGASLPARAEVRGGTGADGAAAVRLHLDEPAHGVALGQTAACYDATDTVCLGGGTIVGADRAAATAPAATAGAAAVGA